MKLNTKKYKITKSKNYFKTNNLFFIASGINKNSSEWLTTEQGLKKINFNSYKLFNKTTLKILKSSTYDNIKPTINGPSFLLKPTTLTKSLSKQLVIINLDSLFFTLLIIKLNNKIYSTSLLKNTYSLTYKKNKLVFYQFNLVHLKLYNKIINNLT